MWARIDAKLEQWLVCFSYAYFCIIILVEVVRRHFFGASSTWGEMTARYAFVFLVYIAAAQVAKSRDHIRIDLVPRLLGPRPRFVRRPTIRRSLVALVRAGERCGRLERS